MEFALILPLLLIIVFGLVEYGRLATTSITLEEAAQEGSIYAATNPSDGEGIRKRVVESVDSPVIYPTLVVIDCPGSNVRVTITHPMKFITPLNSMSRTLTAQVEASILTTETSCVADPPPPSP